MNSLKYDNSTLIIVPVYNGESYISDFVLRIPPQYNSNILFIDDGSTDGTRSLLERNHLIFISHDVNRGKGSAIKSGLNYALEKDYRYVLTIDVDLQHPPEQIPDFLKCIDPDTVIAGWRSDYNKMPVHRIFSNTVTSLLLSIRANSRIKDSQCGFRLVPTKIVKELSCDEDGFQFESELLLKAALSGYQVKHVPIPTIYGVEKSAMRNVRDTLKFAAMFYRSFFW